MLRLLHVERFIQRILSTSFHATTCTLYVLLKIRCVCVSSGEKLDYKACESLEEILKRVQFKVIDLEQTNLDEDVRGLLKSVFMSFSSVISLGAARTLPAFILNSCMPLFLTLFHCVFLPFSHTLILFFTLAALAGCGLFCHGFSDYSRCLLV